MHKMCFSAILAANIVSYVLEFSLAATRDAFSYMEHTHILFQQQQPYIGAEKQQELFNQSYKGQITPLVMYLWHKG